MSCWCVLGQVCTSTCIDVCLQVLSKMVGSAAAAASAAGPLHNSMADVLAPLVPAPFAHFLLASAAPLSDKVPRVQIAHFTPHSSCWGAPPTHPSFATDSAGSLCSSFPGKRVQQACEDEGPQATYYCSLPLTPIRHTAGAGEQRAGRDAAPAGAQQLLCQPGAAGQVGNEAAAPAAAPRRCRHPAGANVGSREAERPSETSCCCVR